MVRWKIHFFVADKWCYTVLEEPEGRPKEDILEEWWEYVQGNDCTFATDDGKSKMIVKAGSITSAEIHR